MIPEEAFEAWKKGMVEGIRLGVAKAVDESWCLAYQLMKHNLAHMEGESRLIAEC